MTLAGFEPGTSCMEIQCSNDCTTKSLFKLNEKFVVFGPEWVLPYITRYRNPQVIFEIPMTRAFRIYRFHLWGGLFRKIRLQGGVK